jgi:hypothetical protein
MGQRSALKLAIDLQHFPAQAQSLRKAALPSGVIDVIRIAVGDKQAIEEAVKTTGRSQDMLREAAGFFVEQVLLHPGADSYRILGMTPDATHGELRRNMALLLRWLHPDRDDPGERAVFASRVAEAWNHLKTEERRAAYDRSRLRSRAKMSAAAQSRRAKPRPVLRKKPQGPGRHHLQQSAPIYSPGSESLLRRILTVLFGRAAP